MAKLTRQLLYAPPDKRIEQVRRAEAFHDEVDPDRLYPFEFISFRITGYRTEEKGEILLAGSTIPADLRLMIDSLSRSAPMPIDDGEPIETTEQLAQRLDVSTKTITRWRKAGLRWRWVTPQDGGRRHIAVTGVAVERFMARQEDKVQRAAAFSHMPPDTRRSIIEQARKLVQSQDLSLNQAAAVLAPKLGRAQETIRVLLEQHDRNQPHEAIFTGHTGPLDAKQKRVILRASRWGVPVSHIACRFKKSRSTIYRIIRQNRASDLRVLDVHFVYSPLFDRPDADEVFLREDEPDPSVQPKGHDAGLKNTLQSNDLSLSPELAFLYRQPVISTSVQRSLFVRFNYLKYKADGLCRGLDCYEPRVGELDEIETRLTQAMEIKNRLVVGNLTTVLGVVRQHLITRNESSAARLIGMLEIGNVVLFEAIEAFDSSGNRTFPAFLKWKLMQRYVSEQVQEEDATRALRRLDPQASFKRMCQEAMRHGVTLPNLVMSN